ncbi:unnamed protein product [Thelazia callipaeda]|uniref:Odontogenic ameloblast-associated protein n=1 Tax=Thelazia callipaeda TaxID=103827 RepID=A0A0N5CXL9_THECL|nr:unnamed protein product [Thelazia callipaeda]
MCSLSAMHTQRLSILLCIISSVISASYPSEPENGQQGKTDLPSQYYTPQLGDHAQIRPIEKIIAIPTENYPLPIQGQGHKPQTIFHNPPIFQNPPQIENMQLFQNAPPFPHAPPEQNMPLNFRAPFQPAAPPIVTFRQK